MRGTKLGAPLGKMGWCWLDRSRRTSYPAAEDCGALVRVSRNLGIRTGSVAAGNFLSIDVARRLARSSDRLVWSEVRVRCIQPVLPVVLAVRLATEGVPLA